MHGTTVKTYFPIGRHFYWSSIER